MWDCTENSADFYLLISLCAEKKTSQMSLLSFFLFSSYFCFYIDFEKQLIIFSEFFFATRCSFCWMYEMKVYLRRSLINTDEEDSMRMKMQWIPFLVRPLVTQNNPYSGCVRLTALQAQFDSTCKRCARVQSVCSGRSPSAEVMFY